MSDTPKTAQDALDALRQRAKEHESSPHEEYQQYAAGIRDAITALEPFIKDALLQPGPTSTGAQKITKLQQDVLDKLRAGWELGATRSLIDRRVWLQKDGLGNGGESTKVRRAVFEALVAGKHIVRGESHHSSTLRYVLAPSEQA